MEVKDDKFAPYFEGAAADDFTPKFVEENQTKVTVPEIPDKDVLLALKNHPMWREFDKRCVSCGGMYDCMFYLHLLYHARHRLRSESGSGRTSIVLLLPARSTVSPISPVVLVTAKRRATVCATKLLHKFHDYKVASAKICA